jgi:phosphoribosyl transferase domain
MGTKYSPLKNWLFALVDSIIVGIVSAPLSHWLSLNLQITLVAALILALVVFVISLRHANWSLSGRLLRLLNKRDVTLEWDDVCRGAEDINKQLRDTGYIPTHIIGIGRGGAILSALISGNLIHAPHPIPFTAIERKYSTNKVGMRQVSSLQGIGLGQCDLSRVLLVASDVVTGTTAGYFMQFLINQNAGDVRFAVLVACPHSTVKPDYRYKEILTDEGLHFPWMLSDNYQRYDGDSKR